MDRERDAAGLALLARRRDLRRARARLRPRPRRGRRRRSRRRDVPPRPRDRATARRQRDGVVRRDLRPRHVLGSHAEPQAIFTYLLFAWLFWAFLGFRQGISRQIDAAPLVVLLWSTPPRRLPPGVAFLLGVAVLESATDRVRARRLLLLGVLAALAACVHPNGPRQYLDALANMPQFDPIHRKIVEWAAAEPRRGASPRDGDPGRARRRADRGLAPARLRDPGRPRERLPHADGLAKHPTSCGIVGLPILAAWVTRGLAARRAAIERARPSSSASRTSSSVSSRPSTGEPAATSSSSSSSSPARCARRSLHGRPRPAPDPEGLPRERRTLGPGERDHGEAVQRLRLGRLPRVGQPRREDLHRQPHGALPRGPRRLHRPPRRDSDLASGPREASDRLGSPQEERAAPSRSSGSTPTGSSSTRTTPPRSSRAGRARTKRYRRSPPARPETRKTAMRAFA